MQSKLFEFVIKATTVKSAKDEDLLFDPYEEFEPGKLSMVEEWERNIILTILSVLLNFLLAL